MGVGFRRRPLAWPQEPFGSPPVLSSTESSERAAEHAGAGTCRRLCGYLLWPTIEHECSEHHVEHPDRATRSYADQNSIDQSWLALKLYFAIAMGPRRARANMCPCSAKVRAPGQLPLQSACSTASPRRAGHARALVCDVKADRNQTPAPVSLFRGQTRVAVGTSTSTRFSCRQDTLS